MTARTKSKYGLQERKHQEYRRYKVSGCPHPENTGDQQAISKDKSHPRRKSFWRPIHHLTGKGESLFQPTADELQGTIGPESKRPQKKINGEDQTDPPGSGKQIDKAAQEHKRCR